jgi:hypothetical protein
MNIKNFGLKFIDIMISIVLGLGFQWWPAITEPWQYVAFIFVYVDIIDYWIDYVASRKKFPAKREVDIILDIAIIFGLFLYIYATQVSISYFLASFIAFAFFDFISIARTIIQYKPQGMGGVYLVAYLRVDIANIIASGILIFATFHFVLAPLTVLMLFIGVRVAMRIFASLQHKHVFLKN